MAQNVDSLVLYIIYDVYELFVCWVYYLVSFCLWWSVSVWDWECDLLSIVANCRTLVGSFEAYICTRVHSLIPYPYSLSVSLIHIKHVTARTPSQCKRRCNRMTDFISINKICRYWPEVQAHNLPMYYDEHRENRLEKIDRLRRRGKTIPKKGEGKRGKKK